ncbi:MAG: ThiF family adenylyltransferase, partial [Actinomycetes bacterium]
MLSLEQVNSRSTSHHDVESSVQLPPLVEPAAELTVDEVRRYSRHIIIPEVGMDGQKRLKNARVLCVGAGGL